MDEKKTILRMQLNADKIELGSDHPASFLEKLKNPELQGEERQDIFKSLKVLLTSKPVSWVEEFGEDGLNMLMKHLVYCSNRKEERQSRLECVNCIKAFISYTFGLTKMLESDEGISILSRCLDPTDPDTMMLCVSILAAVCIYNPPLGHEKVLEGLTVSAEMKDMDRFEMIIIGIGMGINLPLQVGCMQLVNAIICTPQDHLDFRLHLRNEFMRCGLQNIIKHLDEKVNKELQVQLGIFHDQADYDQGEIIQRFELTKVDMTDVDQCFEMLKQMNSVDKENERCFLSILQHLLCVRDDFFIRTEYFRLIEECLTQIVLHKDGVDPDFKKTKRFNIKTEKLMIDLGERRKEITELEKKVSELASSAEKLPKVQAQLDAAMIAKQEIESKAQIMEEQYMTKVNEADEKKEQLENKLKELDAEMNSKLTEVKEQREKIEEDFLNMRVKKDKEIALLKEQVKRRPAIVDIDIARSINVKVSIPNPSTQVKSASEQTTEELLPIVQPAHPIHTPNPPSGFAPLPASPPPPTGVTIPSPLPVPPLPDGAPATPLAPAHLHLPKIHGAPTPDSFPSPSFGAPVPPPSTPFPNGAPIPPPPPPLPGDVPPISPPPGCAPPPPPPPGTPGFSPKPVVSQLPYGMKPKKKYETKGQTKRIHWKKIQDNKLKMNSFWRDVNECEFEDDFILHSLLKNFEVKKTVEKERCKVVKTHRVLDTKSAMNLSMLLGKTSYKEIRRRILEVDVDHPTIEMLEQLIKYLPEPEQIKELGALKEEYDDLTEAEQFIVTIEDITNIKPRLQSILFKMSFSETVDCVKQDLVAATVSLEEIKTNTRFARILKLILFIGNYLNKGSSYAQSLGFDISFLSKLKNTKTQDNKSTLVHFLVSVIEEKYPDLVKFQNDFTNLEKASNVEKINLCEIEKSLKQLSGELENCEKSSMEGDKFLEVMKSFAEDSNRQFKVLNDMYKKMDSMFEDMSEYFCFDKTQYIMKDFFGDIKTFQDDFKKALEENAKQRETKAMEQHATEVKERAQKKD